VFSPERSTPAIDRVVEAIGAATHCIVLLASSGDDLADGGGPVIRGAPAAAGLGGQFASIVRAPDAPGEAWSAARIVRARLESGTRPEAIAVLYPRRQPYAELLAHEFGRAGVPWSGPSPSTLAASASAHVVAGLTAVAGDEVTRTALVGLVATIASGPGGGPSFSPGVFDRLTRRMGVVSTSLDHWVERLEREVGGLTDPDGARRAGTGEEAGGGVGLGGEQRGRWRKDAREAAGAARQVRRLARHVHALVSAASWVDATVAVRAALDELIAPEGDRCAPSDRHGEAERLVLAVLEELGKLDGIDRYEGIGGFTAALDAALDRDGPQVGRLGAGVVVGSLEHAHALAFETVVVLGCAEGDLPARAGTSPLLSAADREASGLDGRTTAASALRDRRRLLLAIAGATEAVATIPRADSRTGRERIASRFLDDGPPPRDLDAVHDGVRASLVPTPDDLVVEALCRASAGEPLDHGIVELVAGLVPALERHRSRASSPCGPYDGEAPGTVDFDVIAPTTIETVAICPFRFFATHLLGIESVDEPERRLSIAPADRGIAMHAILERYVRHRIEGDLPSSDPERAALLEAIAHEVFGVFERHGRTGKALLWQIERRRILANLERERRRDELALAATGSAPVAVEHRFGGADRPGPVVEVRGRSIEFRGTIDRVDRRPDGSIDVVDYKSGSAATYRRRGEDPVGRGRHLQLPVYALAARERFGDQAVRATYRFIGTDPGEVEFRLDAAGGAQFDRSLDALVGTIDAGTFPYRPTDGDDEHCRGCDHDAICPSDRATRWDRVRVRAEMATYVALVEPPAVPQDNADNSDDADGS
jgi:RecB family exonuclease